MKKMTLKMRLLGGLVAVSMLFVAGSCAQGADCDEVFSAGVTNAQLESPILDGSNFAILDTEEGYKLQISWPVVYGAGGYEVKVANAAEPETFLVDTLLDGCTVMVPVVEDNSYDVTVKTTGNPKYNNKPAAEASAYTFAVQGTRLLIPSGSEISSYIAENYQAPSVPSLGLIYELAAGGQYTLTAPAEFKLDKVKLIGDAENRPTVTIQGDACFLLQEGLKIININFDCKEATADGFIELSTTLDPSRAYDVYVSPKYGATYKALGAEKSCYIIENTISLENVMIKDMPNRFFFGNKKAYGVLDLRIMNSIIQMSHSSINGFIDVNGANASVANITISNSTIYNNKSGGGFFLNMGNQNRPKMFGKSTYPWYTLFENSTIILQGNSKNAANQEKADGGKHFTNIQNCILYDFKELARLQDMKEIVNNTVFSKKNPGNSKTYDADVQAGATEPQDPGFSDEEMAKSLDFSLPNGGVNLAPTGTNALADRRGDPRWLN